MTVVAGCSLIDGVLLAADCRMTIQRPGREPIYVDNVQKLFPLTHTTAIGFAGNIGMASRMLRSLLKEIRRRPETRTRVNPIALERWLSRYLRYQYSRTLPGKEQPEVCFMVASVVPGRPNEIERSKIVEMMHRLLNGRWRQNAMPSIFTQILKLPRDSGARLLDYPLGLLYTIESPDFVPQHVKCLEFAAIGEGDKVITEIDTNLDWILQGDLGTSFGAFIQVNVLRRAITQFILDHNIKSVGGLYPCLRIESSGIGFWGYGAEIPVGGTKISLLQDPTGRWVQKNMTTGKEIKLLYPWEIDVNQYTSHQKFDDEKLAMDQLYGDRREKEPESPSC